MTRSIQPSLALIIFLAIFIPSGPALSNQSEQSSMEATVNNMILTEKDNGNRIEISLGSIITVRLESIPGTGYTWYIKKNNNDLLLPLGVPEFEESKDKKLLGGIEHQIFRFKAVSPGTNILTLHYIRKWEDKKPPEKVYSLTIEIK